MLTVAAYTREPLTPLDDLLQFAGKAGLSYVQLAWEQLMHTVVATHAGLDAILERLRENNLKPVGIDATALQALDDDTFYKQSDDLYVQMRTAARLGIRHITLTAGPRTPANFAYVVDALKRLSGAPVTGASTASHVLNAPLVGPEGTKEGSPGRLPWVNVPLDGSSPGGAKEATPPGGASAAPPGLEKSEATLSQGWRPGLLSDAPDGADGDRPGHTLSTHTTSTVGDAEAEALDSPAAGMRNRLVGLSGVLLSIRNMHDTGIEQLDDLHRLFHEVRDTPVTLDLDMAEFQSAAVNPYDAVLSFARRVARVRVCDVNLDATLAALQREGFAGPVLTALEDGETWTQTVIAACA
ncbi:MAG: hypothetical protein V2A79_13220 [Planctomycetota bacterium]